MAYSRINSEPFPATATAPMAPREFWFDGKHVLVVDDNELVRRAFSLKLKLRGCAVTTAADSAEACRVLRRQPVDLVLLDLEFPPDLTTGHNEGIRVLEWIRKTPLTEKLPVIIITETCLDLYESRAAIQAANYIYRKPVNYHELFQRMEILFKGS
jgi:two-component system, OmpR family, phosphate regulon response regulator OmpR